MNNGHLDYPPEIGWVNTPRLVKKLGVSMSSVKMWAEVAKNGNDEYEKLSRLINLEKRHRWILILSTEEDILFIDLGGMSSDDIKEWSGWGKASDDDSGEREQGIGAKAAMRHGSDSGAYLTSYHQGKLCKVGFTKGEDGNLGYMPDWIDINNQLEKCEKNEEGKSINAMFNLPQEDNAYQLLTQELEKYGFDMNEIWRRGDSNLTNNEVYQAQNDFIEAIQHREGWTMVHFKGTQRSMGIPHDTGSQKTRAKRLHKLLGAGRGIIDDLKTEVQISRTLSESIVFFVLKDSENRYKAINIRPKKPVNMPGVDSIILEEEVLLVDKETGEKVEVSGPIRLEINASKTSLTSPSSKYQGVAGVLVNDGRNSVWRERFGWGQDTPAKSTAGTHIWGKITVLNDNLKEKAMEGRDSVPNCVESRAIRDYLEEKVQPLIDKIAEKLDEKNKRNVKSDVAQEKMDNLMENLDSYLDLDALFDDDLLDGGEQYDLAGSIDEITIQSTLRPLNSVNMPLGLTFRMNVIARGYTGNYQLRQVKQLEGLRNNERAEYFNLVSSDEKIVEIMPNFSLKAKEKGTATITITGNSDMIEGDGQANLQVEVIELETPPIITLEPEKNSYRQGEPIRITIEGENEGHEITNSNTVFQLDIDGPAILERNLPPKIVTKAEEGIGSIFVKWHQDKDAVKVDFQTNNEFFTRTTKPKRGDGNERNDKRAKLPKVMICEENVQGLSDEDLASVGGMTTLFAEDYEPTIIERADWTKIGIVWVNLKSQEAATSLRVSMSKGYKLAGPETEIFQRYFEQIALEVALRQVIRVGISKSEFGKPTTFDGFNELREEAAARLGKIHKAMRDGKITTVKQTSETVILSKGEEE